MLIVAWVVYNMYIEYNSRQTYDFERVKSLLMMLNVDGVWLSQAHYETAYEMSNVDM